MAFLPFLTQDFGRHVSTEPPHLLTVRGIATILFRLSQAAGGLHPALGGAVKQANHILTGVDIAWQAQIGPGLALMHPTGVVVGHLVRIGAGCVLQSDVTLGGKGGDGDGHPVLGERVAIGTGARVLGPVTVGDGSIVGANAVVNTDVPADAIAVGVPARWRPRHPEASPAQVIDSDLA